MGNKKRKWKKGDKVKWKLGRALKYSRGQILRHLPSGSELKNVPYLITKMNIGDEIGADSYIVAAQDGTRRIVRTGALKAA